jgi:hypothetical protein
MLKPEASITVGLATAALVYGIYSNALPNITDIRTANQGDPDVAGAEKGAAWTAAAAVAGVSLIAKDPTVFIIGGSMVVALSWFHRHANEVNPLTGLASMAGGEASMYLADDDLAA